jgi:PAS domain S-box-containing protein
MIPHERWKDLASRLERDPGLAPFLGPDAAILLLDDRGANPVSGNAAGLALAARGFAQQTVARLARLASGLAPTRGVRLERLELPLAAGPATLTCACRRLLSADGEVSLLVAAQGVGETGAQAAPAPHTSIAAPAAAPAISGAGAPTRAPAAPPASALPAKLRFLWELAPDGLIRSFSAEAVAIFGQELADVMMGRHWSALCGEVVHDPNGEVGRALSADRTWSGKQSLWRIHGSDRAYRVTLSGLPVTDSARRLMGWRGFGIVQTDTTEPFPPALAEAEAAPPPVPDAALLSPPAALIAEASAEAPHAGTSGAEANALSEPAAPALAEAPEPAQADPVAPVARERDRESVTGAIEPVPEEADEAEHPADVPAEPEPSNPEAPAGHIMADTGPALEADAKPSAPPSDAPVAGLASEPVSAASRSNVVQIRPLDMAPPRLTNSERNAFREIAKALGARIDGEDEPAAAPLADASRTPSEPAPAAPRGAGEQPEPEAPAVEDSPAAEQPDAARLDAARLELAKLEVARLEAARLDAVNREARRIFDAEPPAPIPDDLFASLLDKLPIGVLVMQGGRMIYANRTLLDLLDHDDFDSLAAVGEHRLFRGGAPSEGGGKLSLLRHDGEYEPVDARLSSISWQGEAATLMSFRRALDNVEAQRVEALKLDVARAQAEKRELTAILDTATDGVATLDERGRILSLNRSAEALFGYDQREVTGENFTLLLAPESHITALDYLEGLKGGGVAALLNDGREVTGRVRQGGRIPLYMTMGRVADDPERKYSVVLRDMTAWKRAEADLVEARRSAEQASAQKSDVLAKISHEIRTPLNAILGFTEVMSEERFGPIGNERYKEYLTDIHQSGGYLISLINDLLDLAKIEAGKMDLAFTGVNLNDIASAAVGLLQPEANRQRVVLRTGLQPKLPLVVADERSLRQIVINILSNAVKFTDAGGQVILSTALGDRGEVILRVRDTGIGMTEKELGMAMEPFRQVASTRRTSSAGTGGTGLGLPITKALVEANKGAIHITSAKNEGTLVEVTFPPQRVLAS